MKKSIKLLVVTLLFTVLMSSVVMAAPKKASSYSSMIKKMFNAEEYLALYPELEAFYGKDAAKLFEHFMTYGIFEGRCPSAKVDQESAKILSAQIKVIVGDAAYGKNIADVLATSAATPELNAIIDTVVDTVQSVATTGSAPAEIIAVVHKAAEQKAAEAAVNNNWIAPQKSSSSDSAPSSSSSSSHGSSCSGAPLSVAEITRIMFKYLATAKNEYEDSFRDIYKLETLENDKNFTLADVRCVAFESSENTYEWANPTIIDDKNPESIKQIFYETVISIKSESYNEENKVTEKIMIQTEDGTTAYTEYTFERPDSEKIKEVTMSSVGEELSNASIPENETIVSDVPALPMSDLGEGGSGADSSTTPSDPTTDPVG